jgi:hypothetical protein
LRLLETYPFPYTKSIEAKEKARKKVRRMDTYRPRCQHNIHHQRLPSKKPRPFRVHLFRHLRQVSQKLLSLLVQFLLSFLGPLGLKLQESGIRRQDSRGNEIGPDAGLGSEVRVGGEEAGLVGRVGFFEELADDGRLVEGLVIVLEGRDEAAGV